MRTDSERLEKASVRMDTAITVTGAAHAGFIAFLGDAEAMTLDTTRPRFRIGV
jgi:hypothetical protein